MKARNVWFCDVWMRHRTINKVQVCLIKILRGAVFRLRIDGVLMPGLAARVCLYVERPLFILPLRRGALHVLHLFFNAWRGGVWDTRYTQAQAIIPLNVSWLRVHADLPPSLSHEPSLCFSMITLNQVTCWAFSHGRLGLRWNMQRNGA